MPLPTAGREQLASGLVTTLNYVKQEDDLQRSDDLLVELREILKAWPKDAPVREQLARGLFNAFFCAKQENDLQRRDDLLVELRELHQRCPEDPVLRDLVNFVS
jgi:hypothetical protein